MHIRCHLVMICTHNLNLTLAGPIMDALSHYVRTFSATGCILMMSIPSPWFEQGVSVSSWSAISPPPSHSGFYFNKWKQEIVLFQGNLLNYYLTLIVFTSGNPNIFLYLCKIIFIWPLCDVRHNHSAAVTTSTSRQSLLGKIWKNDHDEAQTSNSRAIQLKGRSPPFLEFLITYPISF